MHKWTQDEIDRFIVAFREMYEETTNKHRKYLEGLDTKQERIDAQRRLRRDYIQRLRRD